MDKIDITRELSKNSERLEAFRGEIITALKAANEELRYEVLPFQNANGIDAAYSIVIITKPTAFGILHEQIIHLDKMELHLNETAHLGGIVEELSKKVATLA